MATASITYDYPNFYWNPSYRYGMESRHTQTSGEYLSPPNSYISYYGYNHFTTAIPYLKSIRVHYKVYCNNYRIIGNYNHGLYVRVGSSWYLAGSVSMSYTTSDNSSYTYMGETDIDVAVNKSNVTDWCIVPTSLPNGSYEWWPSENVGDGRLTIQESLTEVALEENNFLTNIIKDASAPRSENTMVSNYLSSFYNSIIPKALTVTMGDEYVDVTEIYVNMDNATKKITENAISATNSWSWTSSPCYDGVLLYSFTATCETYAYKSSYNSSDDSYPSDFLVYNATTMQKINKLYNSNTGEYIIGGLTVGTKYYILLEVYDSSKDDESLSVDIMMYPLPDIVSMIETNLQITGTVSSLSYSESGTRRYNQNKLIKLNVEKIPVDTYFMMYGLNYGSTNYDGFIGIYDKYGRQIVYCDDASSRWTSIQSTHPELYAKSSYITRDPLYITTEELTNGPFYIEYRTLGLSGTNIMNYNLEWGSL